MQRRYSVRTRLTHLWQAPLQRVRRIVSKLRACVALALPTPSRRSAFVRRAGLLRTFMCAIPQRSGGRQDPLSRRAGHLTPANARVDAVRSQAWPPWFDTIASTASRLNEAGFWRGGNLTKFSICAATAACMR